MEGDESPVEPLFRGQEELILAGIGELSERLLEVRRTAYRLQQEVDRLRPYEHAVVEVRRYRRAVGAVLAAITWAQDLEEAHDLAARALRGDVDGHDVAPLSDDISIDDT